MQESSLLNKISSKYYEYFSIRAVFCVASKNYKMILKLNFLCHLLFFSRKPHQMTVGGFFSKLVDQNRQMSCLFHYSTQFEHQESFAHFSFTDRQKACLSDYQRVKVYNCLFFCLKKHVFKISYYQGQQHLLHRPHVI